MNLVDSLQKLNLKKNESAVYIELLQVGLTNVGPIIKRTSLHRQLVYEALEGLIEAGLATCVIKKGRKHFQACSPARILEHVEQTKNLADKIVPQLLAMRSLAGANYLEVSTLYGQEGLRRNLSQVIESAASSDKKMRIIGGAPSTAFYNAVGSYYSEYCKLLNSKGVKKYLIAPDDASLEFKRKFANEKGAYLRTLKTGLSAPTYTRICARMVTIEIYASEIVIVQLCNLAIAKGYLDHFELLWKEAIPYRKNSTTSS